MNLSLLLALLALLSTLSAQLSAAPLGTAFTYQRRLTDGGAPANGSYEVRFTVWTGSEMIIWGGRSGSSFYNDTYGYTPPRALYLYLKP